MSDLDNNEQPDSFMDRIKESPRTVSALIIILIVAAAIYAFSGDQNRTTAENTTNQEQTSEEGATTTEEGEENQEEPSGEGEAGQTAEASPTPESATPTNEPAVAGATVSPVSQTELSDKARELPAVQTADRAYVETAQQGDGVTHLARRAATRYLAENAAGYELTQAHRIYIEDYIQKKLGSGRLSLGEQKTVSFDLIKEAVDSAGQLNDQQLRNLQRYTPALT